MLPSLPTSLPGSTSPKGKREPPASPASPQSDACSHATGATGELSLQATSSKIKKGNQAEDVGLFHVACYLHSWSLELMMLQDCIHR